MACNTNIKDGVCVCVCVRACVCARAHAYTVKHLARFLLLVPFVFSFPLFQSDSSLFLLPFHS